MNLTLKVWRQKNNKAKGSFETYKVKDISSEMSFLEMFDVLNEITLKTEMLAMNGSERVCAYNWVGSIPDNSITLYDRGFPSFTLFY